MNSHKAHALVIQWGDWVCLFLFDSLKEWKKAIFKKKYLSLWSQDIYKVIWVYTQQKYNIKNKWTKERKVVLRNLLLKSLKKSTILLAKEWQNLPQIPGFDITRHNCEVAQRPHILPRIPPPTALSKQEANKRMPKFNKNLNDFIYLTLPGSLSPDFLLEIGKTILASRSTLAHWH